MSNYDLLEKYTAHQLSRNNTAMEATITLFVTFYSLIEKKTMK